MRPEGGVRAPPGRRDCRRAADSSSSGGPGTGRAGPRAASARGPRRCPASRRRWRRRTPTGSRSLVAGGVVPPLDGGEAEAHGLLGEGMAPGLRRPARAGRPRSCPRRGGAASSGPMMANRKRAHRSWREARVVGHRRPLLPPALAAAGVSVAEEPTRAARGSPAASSAGLRRPSPSSPRGSRWSWSGDRETAAGARAAIAHRARRSGRSSEAGNASTGTGGRKRPCTARQNGVVTKVVRHHVRQRCERPHAHPEPRVQALGAGRRDPGLQGGDQHHHGAEIHPAAEIAHRGRGRAPPAAVLLAAEAQPPGVLRAQIIGAAPGLAGIPRAVQPTAAGAASGGLRFAGEILDRGSNSTSYRLASRSRAWHSGGLLRLGRQRRGLPHGALRQHAP